MVVKIMTGLLSTIGLATKGFKQGQPSESSLVDVPPYLMNAARFIKKRFEEEIVAILDRLDRLTQDEARTTYAEILKVLYGLVQAMNVVMDGE